MPGKTTTADHTREMLESVAQELEGHAAMLRASAALLLVEPKIAAIEVRNEKSRPKGLNAIRVWVSSVQSAAFEARLKASQLNGKTPVSDSKAQSKLRIRKPEKD